MLSKFERLLGDVEQQVFAEPVVMDVSQTTNQNQHAAFLNHDACAGLCLFVNIIDRCFLVFTTTRRCAHMLPCVALGGTSSVNANCPTSIHELDVGAMNGCFLAALRARVRDGKTLLRCELQHEVLTRAERHPITLE